MNPIGFCLILMLTYIGGIAHRDNHPRHAIKTGHALMWVVAFTVCAWYAATMPHEWHTR